MTTPRDPVRSLEVRVGILVIVGLLAVVAAILLSDRVSFERDYTVSVYVQDAGGLREQSPATLAGLRIGEVVSIDPVRGEAGPIRARVTISSRYPLPTGTTVVLATSGIFGDSSLAFSVPEGLRPDAGDLPMDGSARLIAGKGFLDEITGQAKGIVAALGDVLAEDARADIKSLLASSADLAASLQVQAAEVGPTLAAVRQAVQRMDAILTELAPQVAATLGTATAAVVRLEQRANQTLTAVDGAATRAQAGLEAATRLLTRLDALAAALQRGDGAIGQLLIDPTLAVDIRRLVLEARDAARLIADEPSSVVWGADDDDVDAARAARERAIADWAGRFASASATAPTTP
jgi:phospholipid/cholesterol/gamma-HCH transport system substrate-binding protein